MSEQIHPAPGGAPAAALNQPTNGTLSADALQAAHARGERRFSYVSLAGADLSGMQLQDVNLFGADLNGANLTGADLSRANLGRANLRGANLSNANLSDAYVEGADFTDAQMTDVVRDQPSPQVVVTSVQERPKALPVSPAPASTPLTTRYCIVCGTAMPVYATFCPICGQAQPPIPSPSIPSVPLTHVTAPSQPLTSAGYAASVPLAPLSSLRTFTANARGMTIAAISAAIGTVAFFLPGYLGRASGPQLASAFGALSSFCGQYSSDVSSTPAIQHVCTVATVAEPVLWLEVLLIGIAACVAGWKWSSAHNTGADVTRGAAMTVAVCGVACEVILLFQYFVVPSLISSGGTYSSEVAGVIQSAFGWSFGLMVLGAAGAVFGAMKQLRAKTT